MEGPVTAVDMVAEIARLTAEVERLKSEAVGQYTDGLHDGSDAAADTWATQIAALTARVKELEAALAHSTAKLELAIEAMQVARELVEAFPGDPPLELAERLEDIADRSDKSRPHTARTREDSMSIEEAASEAVAIARGEQPAARMYINGHFYVPQADIAALTARVAQLEAALRCIIAACEADTPPSYGAIKKVAHAALTQPAQLAPSAWRPIETAPQDGTYVLVVEGQFVSQARFVSDSGWFEANNEPTDHWGGPFSPTHWQPMPLPPPPEKGGE
jgi:hypothetical protein